MKIIVVNKEKFQNRPPVISVILTLSDLGHQVKLITVDINSYWAKELEKRGVETSIISEKGNSGVIGKLIEYRNFKKQTFKELKNSFSDSLVWVIGGNTILCLGRGLLKYKFILQIQELQEGEWAFQRLLKKIINKAQLVFMNEYNRAVLYQCWYSMKKRPVVLPNKPYFIPTFEEMSILREKYKEKVEALKNYRIILYQGHIGYDRDLSSFVKAVKDLGDNYRLLCVGQDHGMMEKYRRIDPNIIHIPHVPAPDYFVFTSLSYIGIVTYAPRDLNNCYCAPNKIWEYSAFSLPMLCNDIPGLKYTVESAGAGFCVDENDFESIKKGIINISEHYCNYQNNATKFNDSVKTKDIINAELMKIETNKN